MTPDLSDDIRRQISLDPPRYRGVLHSWCAPAAVLGGIATMIWASSALTRVLVAIYALTVVAMFGISAVYHRRTWTDAGWWRMRQLDHTGIYLVIAGSFTGIGGISLDGSARTLLLALVWTVTAAGIALRWAPIVPPFGLMTSLYVLLAALVVPFLPRLGDALGAGGIAWLMGGCAVYLFGAFGLGLRRPDPWPQIFGYHEIWHIMVFVAAAMHWVVVVRYAIPVAEARI